MTEPPTRQPGRWPLPEPMARALIKSREGDTVTLQTPGGTEQLEIEVVTYVPLATEGMAGDERRSPGDRRG